MIEAVVVYESLLGEITSDIIHVDSLDVLTDELSWFCINREVKNIYITIRGEKNEKN